MEHKIVLGGEAFLPFARSRVKALKSLGLPYADQSFEVDGVSIMVRIEPGHEYIRIEGGLHWYSVFPRSLQHLSGITTVTDINGVVTTVTPYAKARPDNKVQLHKHYQTGRFDWVSFDGLKKDGTIRYGKRLITFDGDTLGRYPIAFDHGFYTCWIALQNIIVNGKFAAFSRAVSGIAIKDVELPDGTTVPYIVYASVTHMVGLTSEVRLYKISLSDVFTEDHSDTQIGEMFTVPGLIRQPVYFDGTGTKFVSFFTTYLGVGVTTTHILSGDIDAKAVSVTHQESVFDTSTYSSPPPGTHGGTASDYSYTDTVISYSASLLGIDLTPDGVQQTLVVRYGEWATYSAFAESVGFTAGRSDNSVSGLEYWVGSKRLGLHGTGWSLFGTYGNYDADYETTTNRTFQFGLYDADLRYTSAAWLETEYGVSTTVTFVSVTVTVSAVGAGLKLRAVFGVDEKEKTIRPPGVVGAHLMLLEANYDSKMIASRKENDYMICAHIPEVHHTDRLGYAGAFAGVDISPMAFGRSSGKLVDSDLAKFGLGTEILEDGIRYTPVSLIYSEASLKAP